MTACIGVVEDEPMLLDLVRDVLELEGYDSVGFNHPYQLKALTAAPDLFILDLMLPQQTGIEVAKMLRTAGFETTPMIAMSASASMLNLAKESGLFQELVPKPFDMSHLLETVEKYVHA